jgi:fimbrial chaperone protein
MTSQACAAARALCLWALAGWAVPACAADLALMPVAVLLDSQHQRASVQVVNNGNEPVVLQADAIRWTRQAGIDVDGGTEDLIVNPPLFTVAPGQTQVVRVGLRHAAGSASEGTYRMVLREVPTPTTSGLVSGSVRVLVALRVPVYVAPSQTRRDVRWEAHRDSQGDLIAEVSNHGNVHLKIGALRLREDSGQEAPSIAEAGGGDVLFPGEAHSYRLHPHAAMTGAPLALDVMTDTGPSHVVLDLAPQ